jgi:circadian clock protein KaiB
MSVYGISTQIRGTQSSDCRGGKFPAGEVDGRSVVELSELLQQKSGQKGPSAKSPKNDARSEFMSKKILTLFVTGHTPRSELAIENLRRICAEELQGQFEMLVVDVLEHPQHAEDEKISATPTLIKKLPPPLRRVIGDLTDTEKVLIGLGLKDLDADTSKRGEKCQ